MQGFSEKCCPTRELPFNIFGLFCYFFSFPVSYLLCYLSCLLLLRTYRHALVSNCSTNTRRHYCLQLFVTRDYFYCLQSHHRPVNDLSTVVQLTNRLLRFWADVGFVYYKRNSSPSFLFSSRPPI